MEMFVRSFGSDRTVYASITTFSDDGRESPEWFRWPVSVARDESEMGLTLAQKIHHILKLLFVD